VVCRVRETHIGLRPSDSAREIARGSLDGKKAILFYVKRGDYYEALTEDRQEGLTLTRKRILTSDKEEFFFRLYNHRKWYIRLYYDSKYFEAKFVS